MCRFTLYLKHNIMTLSEILCVKSFSTSNNIKFKKGISYRIEPINFQIGGTQIFRIYHDSGLSFCSIDSVINKFFRHEISL